MPISRIEKQNPVVQLWSTEKQCQPRTYTHTHTHTHTYIYI